MALTVAFTWLILHFEINPWVLFPFTDFCDSETLTGTKLLLVYLPF